jgi:hypothetical protein
VIEVLGVGDCNGEKLQPQETGGSLRFLVTEYCAPDFGIPEKCHTREPGSDFPQ